MRSSKLNNDWTIPALFIVITFTILAGLVFLKTDGTFSYSLDDPYIHLALAENILHGHYGVNLNEPSAPASSIIYPFLLAGMLALGLGQFAPLVINALASLGAVLVLLDIIGGENRLVPKSQRLLAFAIVFIVMVATNLIGVSFTGMEHALHVFTSLLVLNGLIRTVETGRVPLWMMAALIVNPLVRFEGVALSGAAILALIWLGHWRIAVITGLVIAILVGGFMYWLTTIGLDPLPSSVLAKSAVMSSVLEPGSVLSVAKTIAKNFDESLTSESGMLLLIIAAFLVMRPVARRPIDWRDPDLIVAFTVAAAIFAHLCFGQYGHFERYEVYEIITGFSAILYIWRVPINRFLANANFLSLGFAIFFFIGVTSQYWSATVLTPAASRSIYLQQYQMHRFATEFYKGPVAVNDLGWVSFENNHYVLDLWGLGSEKIRRLGHRMTPENIEVLDRLIKEHGIQLIMVYRDWFPIRPASWKPIGVLEMEPGFHTTAHRDVAFYTTPFADEEKIREQLASFEHTLPSGARFVSGPH
jgi:hypothetical protein